jgi:hypothetical protein
METILIVAVLLVAALIVNGIMGFEVRQDLANMLRK